MKKRKLDRCHRCGGSLKKDNSLMWKNQHYECAKCDKEHSYDPGVEAILSFPFEDYDLALVTLDVEMKRNLSASPT